LIAAASTALAEFKVDEALLALGQAEKQGALAHPDHVALWEQRGIAAAYLEDEVGAQAAFDMLLALDPGHLLSYTLSPKATFVFERARVAARSRGAPSVDVTWNQGQRVGNPVTVELEPLADPRGFLHRATVYSRRRGEDRWTAADVVMPKIGEPVKLVLPPVKATSSSALELFAVAYDARGNEVLGWAGPTTPREIPLRYDPPQKWYRKWWVWAIAGTALTAGTGVVVWATTREPPSKIDGDVVVR
jgi:hypothetical protein